jgi:hypothetical protein
VPELFRRAEDGGAPFTPCFQQLALRNDLGAGKNSKSVSQFTREPWENIFSHPPIWARYESVQICPHSDRSSWAFWGCASVGLDRSSRLDRHIDWNFALHTREVSLILTVFPCQLVRRSEP